MGKTGRRKIALVGGVHANVKVNQRIAAIPGIENVFVFPQMGDGGLALGAAYLAWAKHNPGAARPRALRSLYLGPDFSESQIADQLAALNMPFQKPNNMPFSIAQYLRANKIVARFDGRMEYGPRALGNRSILCQAVERNMNDRLNCRLQRTEFMPFAPVIREDDATDFFDIRKNSLHAAEFMTISCDVTRRCKLEAPAIVHVDGSARPQVIRRALNSGYYDILTEYKKLTGHSVLVNTSFNMHEEPIVCSPKDAMASFFRSGLDVLALGPFLITNDKSESGVRAKAARAETTVGNIVSRGRSRQR
jgi:carbamoyltransferase